MKILLITDYYPPETNAPALRCSYHAEYWVKKGHEVTLLTCAPNFPYGKIYDGYSNDLYNQSTINGVNVVRSWSFVAKNDGYFFRILDHISSAIMFSILPIFLKRHDVIVATSPQFLTLISGFLVSFLTRRPLVTEIRDMWPEGIIFLSKDSILYSILEKIEIFIYNRSKKIITVTNSFATSLISRSKVKKEDICISFNGCNDSIMPSFEKGEILRELLQLKDKFIVGYAGTVGVSHGLEELLESSKQFNFPDNIIFVIIGNGAVHQNLKSKYKDSSSNILVLDSVSQEEIGDYLSMFDACLVSLKNIEPYDKVIPSKLFESIAYETPVIAGLRGESCDLINLYKVGEVFHPENAESFFKQLSKLMSNLKQDKNYYKPGILKAKKDFSRNMQAQNILDTLKEIY